MKKVNTNLRCLIRTSLPIMMLAAMTLGPGCSKDNTDIPEPPIIKVEEVSFFVNADMADLTEKIELANKAIADSKKQVTSFTVAGNLEISKEDISTLKKLLTLKENLGTRFNMDGALYPKYKGLILNSDDVDIIKEFRIAPHPEMGYKFWIARADCDKLSAVQLTNVKTIDSDVVLDNSLPFKQACLKIAELAKSGPVQVVLGNLTLNARDLPTIKVLARENIAIVNPNNIRIKVNVTESTPAHILNSLYDIRIPTDAIIHGNDNLIGRLNPLGMNDSTACALRTKDTETKSPGAYWIDVRDEKGNLINPIFGTFGNAAGFEKNKSVDGVPAMPIDITKTWAGVNGIAEDGGFYMLAASYARATNGGIRMLYPHFTDGDIVLKLSSDETFRANYKLYPSAPDFQYANILINDLKNSDLFNMFGIPVRNGTLCFENDNIALLATDGTPEYGELHNGVTSVYDFPARCATVLSNMGIKSKNVRYVPMDCAFQKNHILSLSNIKSQ